MDNHPDTPQADIADEHYTGPSTAVVAAGNGVFQHLKWAAIGLSVGAAGAALFPGKVATFLENSRGFAAQLKTHESSTLIAVSRRTLGKIIHTLIGEGKHTVDNPIIKTSHQEWLNHAIMNRELGFGHWFSTHVASLIPKLGRSYKNTLLAASEQPLGTNAARWTNALTFGGMLGAAGYAGGWVEAVRHGAKHGTDGKIQLQRVQQGIRNEREEKEVLRQKLAQQNQELNMLTTTMATQEGTLRVAPDEPPALAENPTPALLDAEKSLQHADTAEGKHHARTNAAREPITPPENRDWKADIASERAAHAPHPEHAR